MRLFARRAPLVLCLSAMIFVNAPAIAEQAAGRSLPEELFGIRLGGIYKVSKDDRHNLPVAMVAGVEDNFGTGALFHFKPQVEDPSLKYMEYRESARQKHFLTSYRAYLLPMFATTLKSVDEIESLQEWDVEALVIEWVDVEDVGTRETNAMWAIETCKAYRLRYGIEPTVLAGPDRAGKQYACSFIDGHRELSVFAGEGRNVTLGFAQGIIDDKHKALQRFRRR